MIPKQNSNCATEQSRFNFFFTSFLLVFTLNCAAQSADTLKENRLDEVIVKGFEQPRKLKDVAASVTYINTLMLERFGTDAIVHAINTQPGIRLEERSPGSYRINIRGSSLRSPFGVRNVKVYYNDLPVTDPGGNTYLNSLGYYNFSSIEIIKGPGSSVYGAGTGGVMLIEGMDANEKTGAVGEFTTGSYGLRNAYASVTTGSKETKNKFWFQDQRSEGYRVHSSLERKIASWNGRFVTSDKAVLKTSFLYSHLFYQTPGALTKAEFDKDPKAARPAAGGFPSAEQSKASITENTFLAGASYNQNFSELLSNTTSAYGMFTELNNPAIRNYGQNKEPHAGGRTVFRFRKNISDARLNIISGAELQQNFSSQYIYKNKNGEKDTLQTADETPVRQSLIFLQASFERKGWEITAGGSLNYMQIKIKRSYPYPLPQQERDFSNELSPRVSLAKKWKALTAYTSLSRGFSPPASTELFPSGSAPNLSLSAEKGVSNDLGLRGMVRDFSFDVNAFLFRLENTIVQRRDAGGGDYYVNAGNTNQKGVETAIAYPFLKSVSFVKRSQFWLSHTWHHFRYQEFKQLNNDYSGKRLPGVAQHTISSGVEVNTKGGWLANVGYYFSDKIPLNDANSEYAAAYHLLHAKLGFEKLIKAQWRLKLSAGADNLLDAKYSLGNDINAAGGRYYNAAAGRNFYVSLSVQFLSGKED